MFALSETINSFQPVSYSLKFSADPSKFLLNKIFFLLRIYHTFQASIQLPCFLGPVEVSLTENRDHLR